MTLILSREKAKRLHLPIPKDTLENLEYRKYVFDKCTDDPEYRKKVWANCCLSSHYFINTFGWVYEPRKAINLPFITWDFQDEVLDGCRESFGRRDIGVEKSRDMGMSWIFLAAIFHRWLTSPLFAAGLVSRNEDMVDKSGDPDTLMWKLDFLYKNLPSWMQPIRNRVKLMLENKSNGSTISGYAATSDVGRGGRKTVFLMDEAAAFKTTDGYQAWASTSQTSDCRILLSTPAGNTGIFFDEMHRDESPMLKFRFHWTRHSEHRRGMYRVDGRGVNKDKDYNYPVGYKFIRDDSRIEPRNGWRSPWYDEECLRIGVPALIAQELDIDYGGSGSPYFAREIVNRHLKQHTKPWIHRGFLDFEEKTWKGTYTPSDKGNLFLWCELDAADRPQAMTAGDIVIGCDIATGKGGEMTTNSVAAVANRSTREVFAELATNTMDPSVFAEQVAALRLWLQGPYGLPFLIPEANGPGEIFIKRMREIQPARIFRRTVERKISKKKGDQYGWWSDINTKRLLLADFQNALRKDTIIVRHQAVLAETKHYVYLANTGKIEHDRAMDGLDPTATKENHGDRVIAYSLACRGMEETRVKQVANTADVPVGSYAWRRDIRRDESIKQSVTVW